MKPAPRFCLALVLLPLFVAACGGGSNGAGNASPQAVDPLDVEIDDAGFDQVTLDAIAAAEARIEALFTSNLAGAEFDGNATYQQIRINVIHDNSIGSAQSTSINRRRTDGTTLEATIRIRDLVANSPSAREAVVSHEFAHVLQGGQFSTQAFCTSAGWTGPLALAAYQDRVDPTATEIPTQGSDSGTAGCGHWSNDWAHPFVEPCRTGPGPAPEILNSSVGAASVIGRISVGQILDHRPGYPIDIDRSEPYPTPGTCP